VAKDRVNPIIHGGYLHELADAYLPSSMDRKDPRVSSNDAQILCATALLTIFSITRASVQVEPKTYAARKGISMFKH
jgi:hypothetical protein